MSPGKAIFGDIEVSEIIKSRRRTIGLSLRDDAALVVRAPGNASLGSIKKAVLENREWILRKKELLSRRNQETARHSFADGELFYFLGKAYRLAFVENSKGFFNPETGFSISERYRADAREMFARWYRKQAFSVISSRTVFFSEKSQIKFNKIKVTAAGKRWGSCSPERNLSFSWRLILAPPEVIDYVVVHELSHIKEMNHSKAYWDTVRGILPGYEHQKKWLGENGHKISAF